MKRRISRFIFPSMFALAVGFGCSTQPSYWQLESTQRLPATPEEKEAECQRIRDEILRQRSIPLHYSREGRGMAEAQSRTNIEWLENRGTVIGCKNLPATA